MAPAKFDDLCKTGKDLLTEEYQVKGTNLKIKQKTNVEGLGDVLSFLNKEGAAKQGGTLTTAIDIDVNSKSATPTKLTWKLPKPLGLAGIAFDKLELAADGKMALEAAVDKDLHGLADFKLVCKSNLQDVGGIKLNATYTGVANAFIQAEFNVTNPMGDYSAQAVYSPMKGVEVGAKTTTKSPIDVGAKYVNGPMFFSMYAKESFSAFNFYGYYKVNADLKLAGEYNMGGAKDDGKFSAGLAYAAAPGLSVKAKVTGVNGANLVVNTSAKKEVAKGVNLIAGNSFPVDPAKEWTFGMQLLIE